MTTRVPDPNAAWWYAEDVAAYLDIRVATIATYCSRDLMPKPDDYLGRGKRVWRPARIIAWNSQRPQAGVGGRPRRV